MDTEEWLLLTANLLWCVNQQRILQLHIQCYSNTTVFELGRSTRRKHGVIAVAKSLLQRLEASIYQPILLCRKVFCLVWARIWNIMKRLLGLACPSDYLVHPAYPSGYKWSHQERCGLCQNWLHSSEYDSQRLSSSGGFLFYLTWQRRNWGGSKTGYAGSINKDLF